MKRRRVHGHSSLTSLLDVLFILVFASLAHAMAAGQAARAGAEEADEREPPAAEEPPPAEEPQPAEEPRPEEEAPRDLQERAVAAIAEEIRGKRAVYARISPEGDLREIEVPAEDHRLELSVRLIEGVPDPDVKLSYVGDRAPDMRLCSVLLHHLEREDLQDHLVIIVPDAPIMELPVALVEGLRRDKDRCLRDHHGLAVLVDPQPGDLEREEP